MANDFKLLQIGPYPPPVGGWSFHIQVFKRYLDGKGIVNEVLNMGPNRRDKSEHYIDVQGGFDYLLKVFRYCQKRYRVYIHLNGDSTKGLVLTLLAQLTAVLTRQRCTLSFHAGTIQTCFEKAYSLQRLFAYLSFALADGIMCNSEEVKARITGLGVAESKVYAIPCFSMQYLEHKKILTDEERDFIRNHSPLISCYLFFRDEYQPDTIIRALAEVKKQYPGLGCIIIGSRLGAAPYMALAEQLEVREHLLLVGDKEHDNFLSIVEEASVSVRAHMPDGVCSSVMEALALGVPVIACDNGTRPEEVILFQSRDADGLAQQILGTLENLAAEKKRLQSVERRDALAEEFEMLKSLAALG